MEKNEERSRPCDLCDQRLNAFPHQHSSLFRPPVSDLLAINA